MTLRRYPSTFSSVIAVLMIALFAAVLSSIATPRLQAQPNGTPPAALVRDINTYIPEDWNDSPNSFVVAGDQIFFFAEDETNGMELWKTDGTAGGTVIVRDIFPGPVNQPRSNLVAVQDKVFFLADSYYYESYLWVSDGTASGTVALLRLPSGYGTSISGLIPSGDHLIFATNANGGSLWSSDGTVAGTQMIKQIGLNYSTLQAVGSATFFVGNDGVHGDELWRTDGTTAGTTLVRDTALGAASAVLKLLPPFGNALFFTSQETNGCTLWRSDGIEAGTVAIKTLVNDISLVVPADGRFFFWTKAQANGLGGQFWVSDGSDPGTILISLNSSLPKKSAVVGNTLFLIFPIWDGFNTAESLWKYDGTTAGTVLITRIAGTVGAFTGGNTKLFFSENDGNMGPTAKLWVSDGTLAGTVPLTTFETVHSQVSLALLRSWNGLSFFTSNDDTSPGLWRSDGTTAGTFRIASDTTSQMVPFKNSLIFPISTTEGSALWTTDGSEPATSRIVMINQAERGAFDSWLMDHANEWRGLELTPFKGALFFPATGDDTANGLWKSDGTLEGTTLIKQLPIPINGAWPPFALTVVGDTLFFATADQATGWTLWKSDGTTAGTVIVKQLGSQSASGGGIGSLTNVNGTLFFAATTPNQGYELWKSDGSEAGTVIVKDIVPGADSSAIRAIVNVDGVAFVIAGDNTTTSLWKSDGSEAGTVRLKDLDYPSYSSPGNLLAVGKLLYLVIGDAVYGPELWISDGTAAGTTLIRDINPNVRGQEPALLGSSGATVYFTADDGIHGDELWKTDGTEAGTMMVKDINPGAADGNMSSAATIGDALIFFVDDGVHGRELWRSDGSEAGTTLVKDIEPGPFSSFYVTYFRGRQFAVLPDGKHALFGAATGAYGAELWVTDGTADGTGLVQDIAQGAASSMPGPIGFTSERAVFVADDTAHGRELWSLRLDTPMVPPATPVPPTATPAPTAQPAAPQSEVRLPFVVK